MSSSVLLIVLLILALAAAGYLHKKPKVVEIVPNKAAAPAVTRYASRNVIPVADTPVYSNEVDASLIIEEPTNKLPVAGSCLSSWVELDENGKKVSGPHTPYLTMPDGSQICALNGAYVESPLNKLNVNFQYVETPADEEYCQTNWYHYNENLEVIDGPYERTAIDAFGDKWCPTNDVLLTAVPGVTFDYA